MGSLFGALETSSNALDVLNESIATMQNNVDNASTPGYARQIATPEALQFDPSTGLMGGVTSGPNQDTRSIYAEQAVWQQQEALGTSNGQADGLSALNQVFDITGTSGIDGAVNNLLTSFSNWSTNPDDTTARQSVISNAQAVAQSFNQAAAAISGAQTTAESGIQSTLTQINQLASDLANVNHQVQTQAAPDAGLQAQQYNDLEQLSKLTNITVLNQSDGSVTVLAGGQTPLVIGSEADSLSYGVASNASATNPNAPGAVEILDKNGKDVSSQITSGQLGGLLQLRNGTIPSLEGDGQNQGSLNQLAQSFADTVNSVLTSGYVSSSSPTTPGVALFSYTAGSATSVAQSLSLNSSITASQLAAMSGGSSGTSNGNALTLSNLGTASNASLGGMTVLDYYSQVASNIGTLSSAATSGQQTGQQLVAQAQSLRSQTSGVSLDQEAELMMQLQQSYQATAKMMSVVSDLTQSVIDMIQE